MKILHGHSWEPAPLFEGAERGEADRSTAVRPPPRGDRSPAGRRAHKRSADTIVWLDPVRFIEGGPAPDPSARAGARHLARYFELLRERRDQGAGDTPEDLYLVDDTDRAIREVVGFRMRGHPLALFGAFVFPRHRRSAVPHGRPSLAPFLSNPPRTVGYCDDPTPPGHMTIFLPEVEETVPAFMERLRERGGTGIHVDANVIDVAFDLRFENPSEIRQHSHGVARPSRSVFRTLAGHVISGMSVGLYQTLHKDDRFVILTDAVQHRASSDVALPTLAVNRSILALQSVLSDEDRNELVHSTLAFHPSTATEEHLLGRAFESSD